MSNANRLAGETSLYLLQHADNPVDWYPWGQEALDKAKAEDKPIFLSIGYSACHWCHVMAHESFEDPEVAAILNASFVSIKVDREERPDLDRIYMAAVQALTGQGGWPMSVFLTPDGEPFYGGTYFPPRSRYGMPAFTEVLRAVLDAWHNRREQIVAGSQQLIRAIGQQMQTGDGEPSELEHRILDAAVEHLKAQFDRAPGVGWGAGPKFPQPMALEFLLRRFHAEGDEQVLEMVTEALNAMARGGIYDQIGGGFHRYAVDDQWLVPHFEKMLYDNALLARVYLHAWQVTGEEFYRTIVEETLDYVLREMTDSAGGFHATQDADSEGQEGKFFLWTAGEIREILGPVADRFMDAYGVTEGGNFEGRNILELTGTMDDRRDLAEARQALFEARQGRVPPGRDDKVIVSWNGLMLAALAEAARLLGRGDYRQAAVRNAAFMLDELRQPDGRLCHTWNGGQAKVNGYLQDYTHLIEGLIEVYQTTFDARWYRAAQGLAEIVVEHFAASDGGFYDTSDDHEQLIVRPRELQDNAVPSGNGMACLVLLRLAELTADSRYIQLARDSLGNQQSILSRYPLGFGQWLIALDHALADPRQIAIVGEPEAADTQALLRACWEEYRPHQVVAVSSPNGLDSPVPLLRDRQQVDGQATAYVCVGGTCQLPVTDPADLERLVSGRALER